MSLFSRLTLAWRLTLGFGLVLALMVGITLTGIQKVNFIDRSLQQVTDVNAVKQRYAINFRGSVHDRAIVMRDVALETDPARHPPLLSEITRLEKFYQESAVELDRAIARDQDPEELRRWQAIQAIEQRAQPLVRQALTHLEAGRHDDTRAVLMGDLRPAFTAPRAASLMMLARSAPEAPLVARATALKSAFGAMRTSLECTFKIASRPARSGSSGNSSSASARFVSGPVTSSVNSPGLLVSASRQGLPLISKSLMTALPCASTANTSEPCLSRTLLSSTAACSSGI